MTVLTIVASGIQVWSSAERWDHLLEGHPTPWACCRPRPARSRTSSSLRAMGVSPAEAGMIATKIFPKANRRPGIHRMATRRF